MKTCCTLLVSLMAGLSGNSVYGLDHYVHVNGTNAMPPYTNWATAAAVIQEAVDAAADGDWIWVGSGVYSNGFGANAPVAGNSNRVTLDKAITVRSQRGPELTVIQGAGPVGPGGVRCVYLTNGATLSGFTLRNGTSHHFDAGLGGGGAFVDAGGTLDDCVVTDCDAGYGGGVFVRSNGWVTGSTIVSNLATFGAGVHLEGAETRIQNSTIRNNGDYSNVRGGGVHVFGDGLLDGCLIEGNLGGNGGGVILYHGGTIRNCVVQSNQCLADGGGIQCYQGGLVDRCTVAGNSATLTGGGHGGGVDLISGGWLRNSLVRDNTATFYGGGVRVIYGGTVDNCTIVGNSSTNLTSADGGGVACWWGGQMAIRNSIILDNTSGSGAPNWDVYGGTAVFEYCCTTPTTGLPGGAGCFSDDPLFVNAPASDYQLQPLSPCRDAGGNQAWMSDAQDLKGRVRILDGVVDVGAYEWSPGVLYVRTNSPAPARPYGSWDTAAHVIQDAVDEAVEGDVVLVTNGVYNAGGAVAEGSLLTNRVLVNKEIRLESVNGWNHTFIVGQGVGPGGTNNGDGAVRCVYLGGNSRLVGFTLTNGHTRTEPGLFVIPDGHFGWLAPADDCGGGGASAAYVRTTSGITFIADRPGGTVSNCCVTGNSAAYRGGGLMGNRLHNSVIRDNDAGIGGGYFSVGDRVIRCTLSGNRATSSGGGAAGSFLDRCLVISNTVSGDGGVGGGVGGGGFAGLTDCLVVGNSAAVGGGLSINGGVRRCTVYGNLASQSGGGVHHPWSLVNTVVYCNSAPTNMNVELSEGVLTNTHPNVTNKFLHCCTDPLLPIGSGHITNEPAFMDPVAGDFRLRYGSPCIDAGTNTTALSATDLAGLPRLVDGDFDDVALTDIGAYEYAPDTYDTDGDGIPDGWEHGYGLSPTNELDAAGNPDGDRHTSLEEFLADTNPTNAASFLRIVALSNLPPWTVYVWPSSTNRLYTLQSNTNLTDLEWGSVAGQVRVRGAGGTQSLTDSNAHALHFYRVEAGP